jgi:hypothetical protein
MLCVAIWCIAYGFELASTTLDAMLTFTYIEYIGIAFIPAMWLMFTVEFSQLNKLLKPTNIFIIFLFPVMVMVYLYPPKASYQPLLLCPVFGIMYIPYISIHRFFWET